MSSTESNTRSSPPTDAPGAFSPVDANARFPEIEREILAFWEEHRTFHRSLELRADGPRFEFFDGPPFATGLPHYGHLLPSVIKDIVPRYHSMRGHYVERRFGWDCHGLPIEALAQEALGLAGTGAIKEAGVDDLSLVVEPDQE